MPATRTARTRFAAVRVSLTRLSTGTCDIGSPRGTAQDDFRTDK
jgi:hypothetical protein